jgi:hypothetical protein
MRTTVQGYSDETKRMLQTSIDQSVLLNNCGLSSLENTVESSSSQIRDDLGKLEGSLGAGFNAQQLQLGAIHEDVKSRTDATCHQIRKQGRAVTQKLRRIHKNTKLSTDLQNQAIRLQARIDKKIDGLRSMMASITIMPQNSTSRWSAIESANLAAVTLPLMLMKPELFSMLAMLISEKKLTIDEEDVKLFTTEFNSLLSECHMASAKYACECPSTTVSAHEMHGSSHFRTAHEFPQPHSVPPNNITRQRQYFRHRTDAGFLIIMVDTGRAAESTTTSMLYRANFSFTPKINIARTGLSLAFERSIMCSTKNSIMRLLRTYNVLDEDRSLVFRQIVLNDDATKCQHMLTRREISPWDRTDNSQSLIVVGVPRSGMIAY